MLGYTGGYFEILIIMIGPKDYVPIAEIFEPASISQGKVFDGIYVLSTIE